MKITSPRSVDRFGIAVWVMAAGAVLGVCRPGAASHIKGNELEILRTPLGTNQGYLNFALFSNGAEYTGYTDANETFRDGGRDISDNSFVVKPIIVTDSNGETTSTAGGFVFEDEANYSRKIYAQAGLSFSFEGVSNVNSSDYSDIGDFPFGVSERFDLAEDGAGRSANDKTINVYYVKSFDNPNTLGVTRAPGAGGTPYLYVTDLRQPSTVAHEIGHMFFNTTSVIHQPDSDDISHSEDAANLMFAFSDLSLDSLRDIGPDIGNGFGGHVKLEPGQIQGIHGHPGANNPDYITHSNNKETAGDVADFNWVADHELIERISGSSNSADLNDGNQDFLIWEIDASQVTAGPDRGHKAGKLDVAGYDASSFKVVDVFSNINRYADNDYTPGADNVDSPSAEAVRKAKALDYATPEFSEDGIDWEKGELVDVFKPGWTSAATSDNYVARWKTDLDAQFVRIARIPIANIDGHDGNAQIDAVMAASELPAVLEPSTFDTPDKDVGFAGFVDWEQSSPSRPGLTGMGHLDIFGSIDSSNNQPIFGIESVVRDNGDGDEAGTLVELDVGFTPTITEPTLPPIFQYGYFLSVGGTDLDFVNPFLVEGAGTVVPFVDDDGIEKFMKKEIGQDGSYFDFIFQYTTDGEEVQPFQVHGELPLDSYKIVDVGAERFPIGSGSTDSTFIFVVVFGENDSLGGNSFSAFEDTVPLLNLSFAGAIVAVPEPGVLLTTFLTGLLCINGRRGRGVSSSC